MKEFFLGFNNVTRAYYLYTAPVLDGKLNDRKRIDGNLDFLVSEIKRMIEPKRKLVLHVDSLNGEDLIRARGILSKYKVEYAKK